MARQSRASWCPATVGPEPSASSVAVGNVGDRRARRRRLRGRAQARRPPLTAEKCLRTQLISAMEAALWMSARWKAMVSSSEMAGSSGKLHHGRGAAAEEEETERFCRGVRGRDRGTAVEVLRARRRRKPRSAADGHRRRTEILWAGKRARMGAMTMPWRSRSEAGQVWEGAASSMTPAALPTARMRRCRQRVQSSMHGFPSLRAAARAVSSRSRRQPSVPWLARCCTLAAQTRRGRERRTGNGAWPGMTGRRVGRNFRHERDRRCMSTV